MRIKRFFENEEIDISTERVGEIIEYLRDFTNIIVNKNKEIESYITELNNYKNQSKKGNDQIDDSISALQIVKNDLDNSVDKTDTIINNLMNYNEEGRKFLYLD